MHAGMRKPAVGGCDVRSKSLGSIYYNMRKMLQNSINGALYTRRMFVCLQWDDDVISRAPARLPGDAANDRRVLSLLHASRHAQWLPQHPRPVPLLRYTRCQYPISVGIDLPKRTGGQVSKCLKFCPGIEIYNRFSLKNESVDNPELPGNSYSYPMSQDVGRRGGAMAVANLLYCLLLHRVLACPTRSS